MILFFVLTACHKPTVGFLQAGNAVYVPDTMVVRKVLNPVDDAYRIANNAPWVSPKLQGLAGTAPISYEIVDVTSTDGDATLFRNLVTIRGGGRMEFPLKSVIPAGRYVVSVRVSNEGYSSVVENAFTFIVK